MHFLVFSLGTFVSFNCRAAEQRAAADATYGGAAELNTLGANMNFFPFNSFAIDVPMSVHAISDMMKGHVELEKIYHKKHHKEFEGKLFENGFCISLIVDGAGKGPPPNVFDATFETGGKGTLVKVRIRPHYGFLGFEVISFFFLLLLCLIWLIRFVLGGKFTGLVFYSCFLGRWFIA